MLYQTNQLSIYFTDAIRSQLGSTVAPFEKYLMRRI